MAGTSETNADCVPNGEIKTGFLAETKEALVPDNEPCNLKLVEEPGKELPERETWSRRIDFLLACVGFSVGLGNVWRFPYLCYKNGGGAFLIPYFTCVLLAGVPMFFLEVSLGQFMSEGGIGAWRLCPLLQGIGYATTIIVFLLNIYYNVILAWAFYYLFSSFTSVLPWSHCNNPWNTKDCRVSSKVNGNISLGNATTAILANVSYLDNAAGTEETLNKTWNYVNQNETVINGTRKIVDPTTEFWERKVLQISSGIHDMGSVKWDLALCLLLSWLVVYFCIWKGIKSSGKVMYVTATSPYILMFILMIRGVTLPGAVNGIKFYVLPDWSKVLEAQVWVDAGTQIFFSYSISLGTLTALGSFNKFNQNSWRDSILFACCNSGTSFFSGFVIFSVLGYMAHVHGVSVGDVAESGPGLAFIAYPKAVAQMPISPLWSILFFIMIILLGLDSQFVGVEGFVTAIVDQNAQFLRRGRRKEIFIGIVCLISFFIGLCMVTNGGMYVFQLFDYYSGSRIILLVAFFECMAVAWLYGVKRFYDNIEMMLGYRLNPMMMISWTVVTPIFTLLMFGMCAYTYSELTYNRVYHYPKWAIVIGWMLASSSVMMIPGVMAFKVIRTQGTMLERVKKMIRPRLRPHQMRVQDDPKDLMSQYQTRLNCGVIPERIRMIGVTPDNEKPPTSFPDTQPC